MEASVCVLEKEREKERGESTYAKTSWEVRLRNWVIKSHEMAEPELKSQNRN